MKARFYFLLFFIILSFSVNCQPDRLSSGQVLKWNRSFLEAMELDSVLKYSKVGTQLALKEHDTSGYLLNKDFQGQYYYYEGLFDRATQIYLDILQGGSRIGKQAIVGRAYRMLGWIATEQDQFDNGLQNFTRALSLLKKYGDQPDDVALSFYGIAIMNEFLRKTDLAKVYYDSALKSKPGLKLRERAYVLAAYANLERETDVSKSIAMARQGELLLRDQPNHRDMYARPLAELSISYSAIGQHAESRKYALQAFSIYQTLPFKKRHPGTYKNIAKALALCGENRSAYLAMLDVKTLIDSVFNHKKQVIIADLMQKYEDQKKQQRIESLERQNDLVTQQLKEQQRTLWIAIVGSVIILLLISVVYYNRSRYQAQLRLREAETNLRKEKDRIAQDLHDNIANQLTLVASQLHKLSKDSGFNKVQMEQLHQSMNSSLVELRDTIWAINNDEITLNEMEDKVNTLFWRLKQTDGTFHYELIKSDEGDLCLTPFQAVNIFRIVQEAVSNSRKHSGGDTITVKFSQRENQFELAIQDNGNGFDIHSNVSDDHYGLKNMKKRAEEIAAHFSLISNPNAGTSIRILLPLTDNSK